MDKIIRAANRVDLAAILEIYHPYVLDSAISFETATPSPAEFEKRFTDSQAKYPWLVYEKAGQVIAYAYAGAFKNRSAYDCSVESTIYVHRDFHGRGIGKELYRELLSLLKCRGLVNAVAVIALPNDASVCLHESLGFLKVGHFKEIGFKFGRPWDVGYWQLQLAQPSEFKS